MKSVHFPLHFVWSSMHSWTTPFVQSMRVFLLLQGQVRVVLSAARCFFFTTAGKSQAQSQAMHSWQLHRTEQSPLP